MDPNQQAQEPEQTSTPQEVHEQPQHYSQQPQPQPYQQPQMQPEPQPQPYQQAYQQPQPQPYPQQPPQYDGQVPQPGYPGGYPYPVAIPHPGRVLSIIGLVFAFIGLSLVGLILSIIGFRQSKRAGKADVLAILGLIFNPLAILLTVGYILLLVVGFSTFHADAADTKRLADASSIIDVAMAYQSSNAKGEYPRISPADFEADIATDTAVSLNPVIYSEISTKLPSATDPDIYNLSYCGGTDAASATGFQVEYWSAMKKAVQTTSIGTGCSPDSSNGIQHGHNYATPSTQQFN